MLGRFEEFGNGVVVYQATAEEQDVCNIYCETCYCAPDSHCFVFLRFVPAGDNRFVQYVACDFETWEKRIIGETGSHISTTMAGNGKFCYLREGRRSNQELVRIDLMTNESDVIALPDSVPAETKLAISPGERYLAYSVVLSHAPQLFGINLVDLKTGRIERLHEDPYICNPHHQFEPKEGRFLLVQHNRGCVFAPDGTCEKLVGSEGATLFFIEIPGGRVTRPEVGPPYTHSISGHETWMGNSGEAILSLNVQQDYDYGKGPILGVRPDGSIREVCAPHQANHIGTDAAGRVFAADTYLPDEIIVGCPTTNKAALVCPARTSYARAHSDPAYLTDHHPHAYVSPDLKWVIFNSDRDGVQQVYAARLPEEMMSALEKE